ncbi:Fanconi anemia group F protein [Cyprinodon tularosa]|uniref:Fanconi anemia group F protein n=1 Tax=Cyprinodon tularosa TaxID=77115 RepID=UPI0018E253EA|nr:Fanconi anemia group F protein [Cyprinodon tularosa]
MEAVLKNVSSTVELLTVSALSGEVSQWGEQAASRAFHWARYCEQIHARFHSNPPIRGVLEKQLQLTNHRLREALPEHKAVYFRDLGRCQDLLLLCLLNNSALPSSIMKMLFDTRMSVNATGSGYEDVRGLCSQIIQYKSACKVLHHLEPRTVGADAEVQGEMLMERLGSELSRSGHPRWAEDFMSSVLQEFEGTAEHLCLVTAAALLTAADSATQTASQDFLLDWLQSRHVVLQHMCSELPSKLLADLAKRHQKFRDGFCSFLKKLASEMEYRINEGEWIHTDSAVSFQKVTQDLQTLFEACPSLRTETEEEFNALKIADGDFDVRGLSVWGDLLMAFSK